MDTSDCDQILRPRNMNRQLSGFEAALPDNYGWSYEALAEHLNTLRERYLGLPSSVGDDGRSPHRSGAIRIECKAPADCSAGAIVHRTSEVRVLVAGARTSATATAAALAGHVDRDRATAEVLAIQRADGGLGVLLASHLNEREASRLAGVTIGHYRHLRDAAPISLKEAAQLRLVHFKG